MTSDSWWWANTAQDLRRHQLEAVRRQAESWRTGLTSLTALFGAVLIVKGRDNLADLAAPYPSVVVGLLGLALAALVAATLRALRAASGVPGDECLLAPEDLRAWTRGEVARSQRAIVVARRLTLAGVSVLAVAVGLAWLAPTGSVPASDPTGPTNGPMVVIESGGARVCGELAVVDGGAVVIRQPDRYRVVALPSVVSMTPTTRCSE